MYALGVKITSSELKNKSEKNKIPKVKAQEFSFSNLLSCNKTRVLRTRIQRTMLNPFYWILITPIWKQCQLLNLFLNCANQNARIRSKRCTYGLGLRWTTCFRCKNPWSNFIKWSVQSNNMRQSIKSLQGTWRSTAKKTCKTRYPWTQTLWSS